MDIKECIHRTMSLKFIQNDDKRIKILRFEPDKFASVINRYTAFEPFAIKTAESTAASMEGCGSIVNGLGGGKGEVIKIDDKEIIIKYIKADGDLEITVKMEFVEGSNAIRQTNTIRNIGEKPVTLTHFSSSLISGIAMGGALERWDKRKIKVHYCMSHWCGEAQWREADLESLGIYKQSEHSFDTSSFRISSIGTWSTGKYYPLIMIEDMECGEIWYLEHEGVGNWTLELGCVNDCGEGLLFLEANSADEASGFVHTLAPNDVYTALPCVYGCVSGGFEEAVRELTTYKRNTSIATWQKGYAPAIFNDYMNCLWACPSGEKLIPLIDAAASVGTEVFCMDDGWQLETLGTWSIDDEKYGEGGLEGIVRYINDKGMIAGIWLEMEACVLDKVLYDRDCLLHRNGSIVNPKRAHVDFTSKRARGYIMSVIDRFYSMGIRYIKNDHNLSTLIGADNGGVCATVGLRKAMDALLSFIDEVKQKYPDLVIENCGSGGMRSDNGTLSHFEIQSISDQEYYYLTSSIASGSLAVMPPEKAGIWAFPYPVSYDDRNNEDVTKIADFQDCRADGEETVYNMVTALCGSLYLSGRIDCADEFNRKLIAEGIDKFKEIRQHNANSYPVWPNGRFNIGDKGISCIGLVSKNKMTLSVWRRECDRDTIEIELSKYLNGTPNVRMTYPQDPMGASFGFDEKSFVLTVTLPKRNSARFFEIEF